MFSQSFCYCDKKQSSESNVVPVPSHTEMHQRSIFPFLRLCLSFEMNFSVLRPRSD